MARHSLITPALQKTTEGKKRKLRIATGCTPSNKRFIVCTKNHELKNEIAEK